MDTDVISGMESGMSTVLVLSGCSTKDTLKTVCLSSDNGIEWSGRYPASMAKVKRRVISDLIFYTSLYNLNTESDTLIPSLKAIIYNECNKKVIIRKEF